MIYFYSPFALWVGLTISGGCLLLPIIFWIIKIFASKNVVIKIVSISLAGVLSLAIIAGLSGAIYANLTKETQVYTIEETYKSEVLDEYQGELYTIAARLRIEADEAEEKYKVKKYTKWVYFF